MGPEGEGKFINITVVVVKNVLPLTSLWVHIVILYIADRQSDYEYTLFFESVL